MLSKLKELNKDIKLYDVTDEEFSSFGRIIDIDTKEIIETAKRIKNPENGSSYLATVEALEKLSVATEIKNEYFGSLPTQIGYCWGHSNFLDATEWHTSSEVNIAVTPLVLILGHVWDVEDKRIDSSKFKAFYLPEGTAVEVYATSLHYCPCEVQKNGFGCIVALPQGTNTDLEIEPENKLLFCKNKWIICHEENDNLIKKGVIPGITGINHEIKY